MTLTEKHITFENDCRKMFVGETIRAIIYGELKHFPEEENKISPEPNFRTKYIDIDSLDYSIYFKTDRKTIYIFWDNTFTCYGLLSKKLDLTETTNDYEQKWDVSTDTKWIEFIGQKIVDFKIDWYGINIKNKTYPQTFEIMTENRKSIYLTASELKEGEDEYYSQMDNILVTTNLNLLTKLQQIEQNQIKKIHSKKSLWRKILGK